MDEEKKDLERRLERAEEIVKALRENQVDAVVGRQGVLMLRLREMEEKLRESEERLRRSHEELEERVSERTAELRKRTRLMQALAMELTSVEDRERRHLAGVLHDDLQQLLVSVRYQLDTLAGRAERVDKRLFEQIGALLEQAIGRARSLSHELSPPTLHQQGLPSALRWLAGRMKEQHGLEIELALDGDAGPESDKLNLFLYRAASELLFNVVKHSGIRKAKLELERVQDGTRVSVSDDGMGFDPRDLVSDENFGGLGLFSLRERAEILGGRLEIRSEEEKGTTIVLSIPTPARGRDEPDQHQPDTEKEEPSSGDGARPSAAPSSGERESHLIRILLVDDHHLVRVGLAQLLDDQPDLKVIGQAEDGRQGVELAESLRPDVIVMDVSMPGVDGIEATRLIKQSRSGIRIVGLSMYEHGELSKDMLEAGAEAYLSKSGPPELLLAAVRGRPGA